jgi:hypothetical protein
MTFVLRQGLSLAATGENSERICPPPTPHNRRILPETLARKDEQWSNNKFV